MTHKAGLFILQELWEFLSEIRLRVEQNLGSRLCFMFNNLYKSMFREEWWVKPGAKDKVSDADVDEATLEATV